MLLAAAASPPEAGDSPGVSPPETLPSVTTVPVGGVCVCVYSARSPCKLTPNEDSWAVIGATGGSAVLAVADGLGGLRAGDVASRTAIESLRRSVVASVPPVEETASPEPENDGAPPAALRPGSLLRAAILDGIEDANRMILELGTGSATTISVVELQGREVRPYHVGDSATLIVGQRGKIKLQTVCHSPVGLLVEAGILDPQDAMHHEDRHIVSNVVGSAEMRIEIGPAVPLAARDTVLLGSDGLFDNLHIPEIVEIVRKGRLDVAIARLARMATDRMRNPRDGQPSKPDDLTIVAFRGGRT